MAAPRSTSGSDSDKTANAIPTTARASQRSSDYHLFPAFDQSAKVFSAGRVVEHNDFSFSPGRLSDSVEKNARSTVDRLDMHRLTPEHVGEVI